MIHRTDSEVHLLNGGAFHTVSCDVRHHTAR